MITASKRHPVIALLVALVVLAIVFYALATALLLTGSTSSQVGPPTPHTETH
jgi:hypothetical protein